MTATQTQKDYATVWDDCFKQTLIRIDLFGNKVEIEPGVNYFVLALEALGARPLASCEGHPDSFYILFNSSYEVAVKVESLGYFSPILIDRDKWKIELRETDMAMRILADDSTQLTPKSWTERGKRRFLRAAAAGWHERLELKATQSYNIDKENQRFE